MVDLLYEAWKKHLAAFMGWLWDSITFWRSLALALLTLVVVGVVLWRPLVQWFFDQKSHDHDLALFKKADEIVSESFLDELLNANLYHRWCWHKDISRVRCFCDDFSLVGNQFLTRRLDRVMAELFRELIKVTDFVAHHFFPVGGVGDDRLKLYPEPIDRELYEGYVKQLNALTDAAWAAYRAIPCNSAEGTQGLSCIRD